MKYDVLSQNIKKFRKKANLTQKELGQKILKSEILIRKYESGTVNIPPSTLWDICTALNVQVETILGSDSDSYRIENFGETLKTNKELAEKSLSLAENYKKYGDSWHNTVIKIESNQKYLLNTILRYLENTEDYYSSLMIDILNKKDPSLPYFTDRQINDIVRKVTDLVKYEIYKIENDTK